MSKLELEVAKPKARPRRVRMVKCPECGIKTRSWRARTDAMGDRYSFTVCDHCYACFDNIKHPGSLEE